MCRFLKYLAVAAICVLLGVPALCADNPVSEAQKAVEAPTSGETQKPGGTEKTDDAQKADETVQTGKTDESGEPTEVKVDLAKLSLEELMNVEVTIASRTPESWFDVASAVYVLTGEAIKRSGATNIPDALRLVPGVDVAHTSGDEWAVSIRGFNEVFATKLLVMIDGRSVYNPFFSGVYWDIQDVVMEDIDHIEIIRGPGAAMWGSNAVNGVINILTKSASDTQGNLAEETSGSVLQDISVFRYGAKAGKNGYYRVFGKYLKQGPFVSLTGGNANDSYNLLHGGFRADWDTSLSDKVTLQGDIYSGAMNETLMRPFLTEPFERPVPHNTPLSGGNILSRWSRVVSAKSDFALQMYYDRTYRSRVMVGETQETFDLDFQNHVNLDSRHNVTWGLEYRFISDEARNTFGMSFNPPSFNQHLISAFAQGDITLAPNLLHLTVGSKFERNVFTGWEIQPDIRLLWTPDQRHTGWVAVSRAVRTPSLVNEQVRLNTVAFPTPWDPSMPSLVVLFGDPDFRSEELLAYELGYRVRKGERLFLDAAGFYNIYNRLASVNPGIPFFEPIPVPHIVIPQYFGNNMHGNSYGLELTADWRPRDSWHIVAGYTYLRVRLYGGNPSGASYVEGVSPHNQFFLRSSLSLSKKIDFDSVIRYVDKLPSEPVPSYWALDLRFAWKPKNDLEMSLVGRDLLSSKHLEFVPEQAYTVVSEVPRSVYGTITWKF